MASNDNNKRKIEEAESSVAVMKRLQFSDDDRCDNSSGESEEKELEAEMEEEEVSSEESSMNQLDTLMEKLMAKRGRDLFFSNDGNTSLMESEPRSPETHSSRVCSDPDNSDDDDDDFWM
jgi:hypothetical protein